MHQSVASEQEQSKPVEKVIGGSLSTSYFHEIIPRIHRWLFDVFLFVLFTADQRIQNQQHPLSRSRAVSPQICLQIQAHLTLHPFLKTVP